MKCCLLAFNILVLGPVLSLELFVSRAYVASFHAYYIYPRPVFSSEKLLLYFEKATRFCREVLMFLPSIWLSLCFSSSMNRFIAPFVPSGTTLLKCSCLHANQLTVLRVVYSCFEKGCPTKPYATMPKGIMGNGGLWYLIEALGVSAT